MLSQVWLSLDVQKAKDVLYETLGSKGIYLIACEQYGSSSVLAYVLKLSKLVEFFVAM